MNSNTISLRVFFILLIALVGGIVLFLYASRVVTPLAVCLLPTDAAEARYTNPVVLVEFHMNSQQQVFHSNISYAGHTGILLSTSPPTPLINADEEDALIKQSFAERLAGIHSTPRQQPPEPTFPVRFVRAFPSFVVRDIPNGSIWQYYADTWAARDFISFLVPTGLIVLVSILFYRHLRRSRRRRQW